MRAKRSNTSTYQGTVASLDELADLIVEVQGLRRRRSHLAEDYKPVLTGNRAGCKQQQVGETQV